MYRRGRNGVEVVVIHRPEQDDWTLPKGKVEAGETSEEAALREVWEETGLDCQIIRRAGCTAYVDRKGRDKEVCYWLMQPLEGEFRPTAEVDEMRWLPTHDALTLLTYPQDKALLEAQAF